MRAEDPWIILSRQRNKEKVAEQKVVTQIKQAIKVAVRKDKVAERTAANQIQQAMKTY
jgi:hypothetical protein